MHTVHNERVKLIATWLNNVSVGLALTGAILPFAQRPGSPFVVDAPNIKALGAWMVATGLGGLAGWYLGRLREPTGTRPPDSGS